MHSGGSLVLENLAGTDCTDQILVYHPSGAIDKYLTYFYIGDINYKDDSKVMCSFTLVFVLTNSLFYNKFTENDDGYLTYATICFIP